MSPTIAAKIARNAVARNACKKLQSTPASETVIIPFLSLRKLRLSIGTGLPQPKPMKSNINSPVTSKCLIGFNVSLPAAFAV